MHYYKRNLGDYAKKAGRLSMLQHGSYTLLIDACYDRERFPTLDEAIEWTWASTTEEVEAVTFVLRRFFTLEDGIYVQERIKEEIAEYHSKAETNKRIAMERETKRREKSTVRAHDVNDVSNGGDEPPPNQEPITNNQEPVKEQKTSRAPRFDAQAHLVSIGVDASIAADWIQSRNALKAKPTLTAINAIANEAERSGTRLSDVLAICCQRGWRGFKAEWLKNGDQEQGARKTQYQINQEATARAIFGTRKPSSEPRVITGEVVS